MGVEQAIVDTNRLVEAVGKEGRTRQGWFFKRRTVNSERKKTFKVSIASHSKIGSAGWCQTHLKDSCMKRPAVCSKVFWRM